MLTLYFVKNIIHRLHTSYSLERFDVAAAAAIVTFAYICAKQDTIVTCKSFSRKIRILYDAYVLCANTSGFITCILCLIHGKYNVYIEHDESVRAVN
jgi:hypothetical protein